MTMNHNEKIPQRIEWVEKATTEYELNLPGDALLQGHVTWQESEKNAVFWGSAGGLVICPNEELGNELAEVINGSTQIELMEIFSRLQSVIDQQIGNRRCSLYWLLYQVPLVDDLADENESVISIPFQEVETPEGLIGNPWVLGICDGEILVSHASASPRYEVNGYRFSWVGVRTHKEYRRKGFARAVVSALLRRIALEPGVAIWQCHALNTGSIALAQSLGFIHHSYCFVWEPADA